MKRYFYDCPIKAAYMAKYHGMKFKSARGQNLYFDGHDFRTEKDCGIYAGETYHIPPDSENILKPLAGDVRCFIFGDEFTHGELKDSSRSKLFQRNGVPFIWPEVSDGE